MRLRCAVMLVILTCILKRSAGQNHGESFNEGDEESLTRDETDSRIDKVFRERRQLIYNGEDSVLLMTVGFTVPVPLDREVVLIGPFVKSMYQLPYNGSCCKSEPDAPFSRAAKSRWSFYKVLEAMAEMLGFGGKECVLRAICEAAKVPFDDSHGLLGQLLHVFLTPSSTDEAFDESQDRRYFSAERLGRRADENCQALYPDCRRSVLDVFSVTDC